ncbi:MAG: hypothetical protein GXZ02_09665 [Clostridiales bacterium]|nr:hypothetical protein [Clostridiales bacterium]
MKIIQRRAISVFLAICIVAGAFSVMGYASNGYANPEIITVSSYDDLNNLNKNVPVVSVNGLGCSIYKGLLTSESESDYVQIWAPPTDVITEVVALHGVELAASLITEDYDKLGTVLCEAMLPLFGELACDSNGVPNPDTGIKPSERTVEPALGYGYSERYQFEYDWRLDMHTIAAQLDEYINEVLEVNKADQVALTAMSMGSCILTTYLYEYYYTNPDYASRNHISAAVFVAGGMNGIAACGDPFSGNINIDSTSLMRMLAELWIKDDTMKVVYYMLELLYSAGLIDSVTDYANKVVDNTIDKLIDNGVLKTIGTIPGFYALMSESEYEACEAYIFNTDEKKAEFSGLLEKNRYYHDSVQSVNRNIIERLLDDGIKTAVIAQYGYTMAPITSDNNRMSDGVITTAAESFGATCAEVDGTLGDDYVQAVSCPCGKSHISADNQIDASTCAFADITWFAKNLRHTDSARFFANLIDLVVYADEQTNVFTYTEFPQFMVSFDDETLEPLTAENAGPDILPYEQTTLISKLIEIIEMLINFIMSITAG